MEEINVALGIAGAVITLGLSAVGSGLGTGRAGASAVGAWKKCYAQGKPAPFILLSYVGAPITQTLYGMIVMFVMINTATSAGFRPGGGIAMLIIGIFSGIAMGLSARFQGLVAAAAADSQAETGSGLANNMSAIGIVETVAIFVMVFTLIAVGNLAVVDPAAVIAAAG